MTDDLTKTDDIKIKYKSVERDGVAGKEWLWDDNDWHWIPDGILSLQQLEAFVETDKALEQFWTLQDKFNIISTNIMHSDVENKSELMDNLMSDFRNGITEILGDVEEAMGDVVKVVTEKTNRSPLVYSKKYGSASVFKAEDGSYSYFGIYSNNFEDRHEEIISAKAHMDFVNACKNGDWDYPFLFWYHIPVPIGKSEFLYYDEKTGMAYVAGKFYEKYHWLAEKIMKNGSEIEWGMSHGMPIDEIRKNASDDTVYERYRSFEVTILDVNDAANYLTMLSANDQGVDKKMDKQALAILQRLGVTDKEVESITEKGQRLSSIGVDLELRRKSNEDQAEEVEQPVNAKSEATEASQSDEEVVYVTDKQMMAVVKVLADIRDDQNKRIENLEKEIKSLSSENQEQVYAKALLTPAASLQSGINLGSPVPQSHKQNAYPSIQETPFEGKAITGIQFIDDMLNEESNRG